jgi:transcriptional regulator with XRE-family HTH domain
MTLNEYIKKRRKHLGLTQEEFSRRIGIGQAYLALIENGKRDVPKKVLIAICETYGGMSEEPLKAGNGEMFAQSLSKKVYKIMDIFSELVCEFQDYMLMMDQTLSELQKKQIPSAPEKNQTKQTDRKLSTMND